VDFPHDAGCAAVDDQFMFGPEILAAPVLHLGQRERSVYLPAGAAWTNAWSGETLPGGQSVRVSAPLERAPVFLRAGSRLLEAFKVYETV
jgi:alpha-D-xyloside xylohydrolase